MPEDPIDSDDLERLRHEILRLRDLTLGLASRAEVLEDRVQELEAHVEHLGAELARHPVVRVARRMARPLRRA